MPPCPPGPSHHAILRGSALLHGVFKQHVALGVTETHPAWPPQPVGTQGVSKDPPFGTPPLGTTLAQHWAQGCVRRAQGGCPAIWGGQEKDDVPLGCQAPRCACPRPGWPNAAVLPGASSAWVPWAPLPRSSAKLAPSRKGIPAGKGSRAGPAGSRALGPGCKLGAFSAPFGSPGRSWKLVTTLLCKGAWKRGRAEETGAGRREGEERLRRRRAGHCEDGDPGGSDPAMPAGRARGAARRLCPAAPASSAEPWSHSHLFPLQTWRRRGEAGPAPWVCRNPGCSPGLDPQHIAPLPKSLSLPMQGSGTVGGCRKGN